MILALTVLDNQYKKVPAFPNMLIPFLCINLCDPIVFHPFALSFPISFIECVITENIPASLFKMLINLYDH